MIKLSNSSILLICPDGTRKTFDPEELETRIIKSCLAAGIREAWIAEDISLAVEFSLESLSGKEQFFSLSEINAMVVKILQETGYPAVAEKYMGENSFTELELDADKKNLSDIFSVHLGLNGQHLDSLVAEVMEKLSQISISKASPTLFLEIARHFRKSSRKLPEKIVVSKTTQLKSSPWLISKEEILSAIPQESMRIIKNNILGFGGVSRLFPALKMDLKMMNITSLEKLSAPITELSLFPILNDIASSLNAIMKTVFSEYQKLNQGKDLPFYLFVSDMSLFASEWLSYEWPGGKSSCMEIIEYLEKSLDYKFFKIKMK